MLTLSNTNQVCTTSRTTKVVGLKRAGGRKQVVRTQATNNHNNTATVAGIAASTAGVALTAAQSAHAATSEVAQVAATYNLEDSQVFAAVFISLLAGIMATRLGNSLYK